MERTISNWRVTEARPERMVGSHSVKSSEGARCKESTLQDFMLDVLSTSYFRAVLVSHRASAGWHALCM